MARRDFFHMKPYPSLNRLKIGGLPIGFPGETNGFALLSSAALNLLIEEQATRNNFPLNDYSERERPFLLDQWLESSDAGLRRSAESIVETMGTRLAALIAVLWRGDGPSDKWLAVKNVWLGGGLAAGKWASRMVEAARQHFPALGITDWTLNLARYPAIMPLIGAARYAPADAAQAIVLDFGGTYIKRAVASYENGVLTALTLLSNQPARYLVHTSEGVKRSDIQPLFDHMVDVITETWHESSARPAPLIAFSLASYIEDGQPVSDAGYGLLRLLSSDVTGYFQEILSLKLGQSVRVRLLHDGSAAATAIAHEPDAAIIMLGTALGSGFPPLETAIRPVVALGDLRITEF